MLDNAATTVVQMLAGVLPIAAYQDTGVLPTDGEKSVQSAEYGIHCFAAAGTRG
jgi:hypothetical protein